MKVQINIIINPFSVPDYVTTNKEHFIPKTSCGGIPLSYLDEITLEKMCDEFRTNIFKKAGKNRPPQQAYTIGEPK